MRLSSNWIALIALSLAMLIVGLDTTVLNVALPTISDELQASNSQLQWIVNSYTLALAAVILPAGVIGDRYGRKRTLLIGLAIFLIGSVASALTTSTSLLIAMRAVMGVGAAIIIPIVMAMLPLMFDDRDRPRAVGIMATAASIGLPLGLIVGGYLLNNFAWHSIFWINVPIVVIAGAAVIALIDESRAPVAKQLDIPGALLAVAGIVSLVYGFIEAPGNGWGSLETIGFAGGGVVVLLIFAWWQTRTSTPLVQLDLFRNRRFVGGTLAVTMLTFVLFGLLFTLPQYLQAVRGNDALGTGVRLIPMMLGLMVAATASKRMLSRFGSTRVTVSGLIVISVVLAALSRLSTTTDMLWIALGLTVLGLGLGMTMTAGMDAVLGSLPRTQAGAGSGVVNAMRQVSGALGVAILGSIVSTVYQNRLDDSTLQSLPPESSSLVKESIVAADRVASSIGAGGDAVRQMASGSYTDAMSIALIICAGMGIVAAMVSGLVLSRRQSAEQDVEASTMHAMQEPLI